MPTGIYKRKYDFITKEFLDREYTENRKTKQQVADIIGCSIPVIRNKLNKYNISLRTRSEAMRGREFTPEWRKNLSEAAMGRRKYNITKAFLVKEYSKNEKTPTEIGKQVGYSRSTILKRLRQYNIHIRSRSESLKIKYNFITKKFLLREYSRKKKPPYQIGQELGCSYRPVVDRLIKFGIPIRNPSEASKFIGKRGKKRKNYNPENYKKHYCIEPYCNNEICLTNWYYGNRKCVSCANRLSGLKRWKDPIYREKQIKASFKGSAIKPNRSEKKLDRLLQKLLPNEYKFVGNGQVILGGFCPDFVNCNSQKKLIELYGDYWHSKKWTGRTKKQEEQRRIKHFAKYGYKTLIIWEYELNDLDGIEKKVLTFNKRRR